MVASKRIRTSDFFALASRSQIGKIMNPGMAIVLMGIALFAFDCTGYRMPPRTPVVLGQRDVITGNWPGKNSGSLPTLGDETARGERPLRIATYNVHECTGVDFWRDPERIAAVIRSLDADIVALQEVLSGPGAAPSSQVRFLAEKTGMYMAVAGPTISKADGQFGNALLSRFPIAKARLHDISVGAFEPRGIIDADIEVGDLTVRVLATHFGQWPMEGKRQAPRLLEILGQNPALPVIVMGDMNGWVPGNRALRRLEERLGKPAAGRTYPAPFPLLSLDRIWFLPAGHRLVVEAPGSPLAGIASDHLPMVATVSLRGTSRSVDAAEGSSSAPLQYLPMAVRRVAPSMR